MALYTVQPGSVVNAADPNQFTNLLNGTTTGVQITNSGRIRAQLNGATSGSGGYVGQVAGGAPSAGTFLTGDFVSDGTLGTEWICTAGGTPGTWAPMPGQVGSSILNITTASVTFSSIPAFNRIVVYWRARTSASGLTDLLVRIDGNTGSNYLWSKGGGINGAASAAHAGALTTSMKAGILDATTASYFSSGTFTIDGWVNSTGFTTLSGTGALFSTTTVDAAEAYSGQFNVVGPHTSITLLPGTNSFAAGSQFSLYGMM